MEKKIENHIERHINCHQCYQELPSGESMAEWAHLNVGFTSDHDIQVWCVRHNCNVAVIDRKTGSIMGNPIRRVWLSQIPVREIEKLKSDSQFLVVLRLCRHLNQINFCMQAVYEASLEMPPASRWTPSGRRQWSNSIWFLMAVLHESFRVIPDLGKELRHTEGYQSGFATFFKRTDVADLKQILKKMRNSLVFHVDLDVIDETLRAFELPIYVFSVVSEDEQSRRPETLHPHEVYFPLVDEIAFSSLIGAPGTPEGANADAQLMEMLFTVAGHFGQCGLSLLKDYRKSQGWNFELHKDMADAYVGLGLERKS